MACHLGRRSYFEQGNTVAVDIDQQEGWDSNVLVAAGDMVEMGR